MSLRTRTWVPFAVITVLALGAAVLTATPTGLASDLRDLGSSSPDVRNNAVDRLSRGNAEVTKALLDELDGDHSALTKASIAQVARKIGVSSANSGVLKTCLESPDAATRQAAIAILHGTGNGSLARAELTRIAANSSELPALRAGAAAGLATAGAGARTALKDLAIDSEAPASVRVAGMRALASCSEAGAKDVLAIVNDRKGSQAERVHAIRALVTASSHGPDLLKPLTIAPQVWMRRESLDALASTGQGSYTAQMVVGMADANADVRHAALRGLITVGAEKGQRNAVRPLMNDADARVQALAARSVGRTCAGIAGAVRAALQGLLGSGSFHVRYEAAMALFVHGSKAGLATMTADALTPNIAQARKAKYAANLINSLGKKTK